MPIDPRQSPYDPDDDQSSSRQIRPAEMADGSVSDDLARAETRLNPQSLDAQADADLDAERVGRSVGAPDVPAETVSPSQIRDGEPTVANHIGEAAGGLSGAVTGAAIGSVGGPVGTLIGGIAGAVGGWWAGRAIADAATRFTEVDDAYYRERYESSRERRADRRYEDVRHAYQIGHLASLNPEYAGREFEEIEPDLRHGWRGAESTPLGDWEEVRPFAREAFADASSRRIIGPDAERPITPVRDADARDEAEATENAGESEADSHVELSEAADPLALGDNTSVTGYALGLTDEDVPPEESSRSDV